VVLVVLDSTPVKMVQVQPQVPEIKVAQVALIQAVAVALQIDPQRLVVLAAQA
jgi:hypothetical protein